ncbi:polysaccharide deacetylase family protein [Candidatus Woesearchaeota archaeon]|nr:polysaccharide deacetylase family protein [Candidatus Woesearchaeota archaeon]
MIYSSGIANAAEKGLEANTQIRILIDPGHSERRAGAKGKAGEEHILTLEAAKRLEGKFQQDTEFKVELTRVNGNYRPEITQINAALSIDELAMLDSMNKQLRIKEAAPNCTNKKVISLHNQKELYAIAKYASSKSIDALVSLHYDSHTTDKGYWVFINPENSKFGESMQIARNISHMLSLEYSPSLAVKNGCGIRNNAKLTARGISLRNLALLRSYPGIETPSVLIELGSIDDTENKKEARQDKLASLIYEGIRRSFDKHISSKSLDRGYKVANKISLTFDGDWLNTASEEILSTLKKKGVKATFFLTGGFMRRYPKTVLGILDGGHEVGNHTDSHPRLTTYSKNLRHDTLDDVSELYLIEQLEKTEKEFYRISGKYISNIWRAPYGEHNKQLREWAKNAGYHHVGWTVDSLDWVDDKGLKTYHTSTSKILDTLKCGSESVNNGAIILMHLGSTRKEDQFHKRLPGLIDSLKECNYNLVRVSELK